MKGFLKGTVIATLLLVSFQNCTVHQSESRKYLERFGFNGAKQGSCVPYLSASAVAPYFGNRSPATTLVQDQDGALGCLIYLDDAVGANSTVCWIRSDAILPTDFVSVTNDVSGWTGTFKERTLNSGTKLEIGGLETGDVEGIRCQFTFSTAGDLTQSRTLALSRAKGIIVEMTQRIPQ